MPCTCAWLAKHRREQRGRDSEALVKHQWTSQPGLPLLLLFLQQVVAGENTGCTSLKPVVAVCLFIKVIQCLGKMVCQLRQLSRCEYVVIAASKLAAQAPPPCQ